MKKSIISLIVGVGKLLLISLICYLVYEWNDLAKVFGPVISYLQWLGIIVIINILMPDGINSSKKENDKQRP
ncbi:hypothetical protein UFOVP972_288 [uncultured Caudovirales phage]|jgi:hypothetical protein|uniref:Uncharacterized protein n=1 Tax=uncultured Caudovirales phage TaxID=2100421 RepID=A0A6J5PV06_9CAUD|nr:hypothetical protein UFOVP972_288 [uncultured Caudovirales phage]